MLPDLYDELLLTTRRVCEKSLRRHAGEDFYSVALYSSGDYVYVVDSFATLQGLSRSAKRYMDTRRLEPQWASLETAVQALKWSPCDSPYHCEFVEEFGAVQSILDRIWSGIDEESEPEYLDTCEAICQTCIAVLASVRESGLFDNERVVFNFLIGDQDDESRVLTAERLNPERVLKPYREELEVDERRLAALRKAGLH